MNLIAESVLWAVKSPFFRGPRVRFLQRYFSFMHQLSIQMLKDKHYKRATTGLEVMISLTADLSESELPGHKQKLDDLKGTLNIIMKVVAEEIPFKNLKVAHITRKENLIKAAQSENNHPMKYERYRRFIRQIRRMLETLEGIFKYNYWKQIRRGIDHIQAGKSNENSVSALNAYADAYKAFSWAAKIARYEAPSSIDNYTKAFYLFNAIEHQLKLLDMFGPEKVDIRFSKSRELLEVSEELFKINPKLELLRYLKAYCYVLRLSKEPIPARIKVLRATFVEMIKDTDSLFSAMEFRYNPFLELTQMGHFIVHYDECSIINNEKYSDKIIYKISKEIHSQGVENTSYQFNPELYKKRACRYWEMQVYPKACEDLTIAIFFAKAHNFARKEDVFFELAKYYWQRSLVYLKLNDSLKSKEDLNKVLGMLKSKSYLSDPEGKMPQKSFNLDIDNCEQVFCKEALQDVYQLMEACKAFHADYGSVKKPALLKAPEKPKTEEKPKAEQIIVTPVITPPKDNKPQDDSQPKKPKNKQLLFGKKKSAPSPVLQQSSLPKEEPQPRSHSKPPSAKKERTTIYPDKVKDTVEQKAARVTAKRIIAARIIEMFRARTEDAKRERANDVAAARKAGEEAKYDMYASRIAAPSPPECKFYVEKIRAISGPKDITRNPGGMPRDYVLKRANGKELDIDLITTAPLIEHLYDIFPISDYTTIINYHPNGKPWFVTVRSCGESKNHLAPHKVQIVLADDLSDWKKDARPRGLTIDALSWEGDYIYAPFSQSLEDIDNKVIRVIPIAPEERIAGDLRSDAEIVFTKEPTIMLRALMHFYRLRDFTFEPETFKALEKCIDLVLKDDSKFGYNLKKIMNFKNSYKPDPKNAVIEKTVEAMVAKLCIPVAPKVVAAKVRTPGLLFAESSSSPGVSSSNPVMRIAV